MDYTEALMNLIMVLGFVLVFSPKTSYIYCEYDRETSEVLSWDRYYSGSLGSCITCSLNNLNRA